MLEHEIAEKLTGLEFSADILTALSRDDSSETGSLFGGESVDKPRNSRRLSTASVIFSNYYF
jgi:hypothetical protein